MMDATCHNHNHTGNGNAHIESYFANQTRFEGLSNALNTNINTNTNTDNNTGKLRAVFAIGVPGSGKSTWGSVAKGLGWTTFDYDYECWRILREAGLRGEKLLIHGQWQAPDPNNDEHKRCADIARHVRNPTFMRDFIVPGKAYYDDQSNLWPYRAARMQTLREMGYSIEALVFLPSAPPIHLKSVQQRYHKRENMWHQKFYLENDIAEFIVRFQMFASDLKLSPSPSSLQESTAGNTLMPSPDELFEQLFAISQRYPLIGHESLASWVQSLSMKDQTTLQLATVWDVFDHIDYVQPRDFYAESKSDVTQPPMYSQLTQIIGQDTNDSSNIIPLVDILPIGDIADIHVFTGSSPSERPQQSSTCCWWALVDNNEGTLHVVQLTLATHRPTVDKALHWRARLALGKASNAVEIAVIDDCCEPSEQHQSDSKDALRVLSIIDARHLPLNSEQSKSQSQLRSQPQQMFEIIVIGQSTRLIHIVRVRIDTTTAMNVSGQQNAPNLRLRWRVDEMARVVARALGLQLSTPLSCRGVLTYSDHTKHSTLYGIALFGTFGVYLLDRILVANNDGAKYELTHSPPRHYPICLSEPASVNAVNADCVISMHSITATPQHQQAMNCSLESKTVNDDDCDDEYDGPPPRLLPALYLCTVVTAACCNLKSCGNDGVTAGQTTRYVVLELSQGPLWTLEGVPRLQSLLPIALQSIEPSEGHTNIYKSSIDSDDNEPFDDLFGLQMLTVAPELPAFALLSNSYSHLHTSGGLHIGAPLSYECSDLQTHMVQTRCNHINAIGDVDRGFAVSGFLAIGEAHGPSRRQQLPLSGPVIGAGIGIDRGCMRSLCLAISVYDDGFGSSIHVSCGALAIECGDKDTQANRANRISTIPESIVNSSQESENAANFQLCFIDFHRSRPCETLSNPTQLEPLDNNVSQPGLASDLTSPQKKQRRSNEEDSPSSDTARGTPAFTPQSQSQQKPPPDAVMKATTAKMQLENHFGIDANFLLCTQYDHSGEFNVYGTQESYYSQQQQAQQLSDWSNRRCDSESSQFEVEGSSSAAIRAPAAASAAAPAGAVGAVADVAITTGPEVLVFGASQQAASDPDPHYRSHHSSNRDDIAANRCCLSRSNWGNWIASGALGSGSESNGSVDIIVLCCDAGSTQHAVKSNQEQAQTQATSCSSSSSTDANGCNIMRIYTRITPDSSKAGGVKMGGDRIDGGFQMVGCAHLPFATNNKLKLRDCSRPWTILTHYNEASDSSPTQQNHEANSHKSDVSSSCLLVMVPCNQGVRMHVESLDMGELQLMT